MKMKGRELKWKDIQKWARIYDAEQGTTGDGSSDSEDEDVVVINVGRDGRNRRGHQMRADEYNQDYNTSQRQNIPYNQQRTGTLYPARQFYSTSEQRILQQPYMDTTYNQSNFTGVD